LDTGPIISRHAVDIAPDGTAGALHDMLAAIGADAIVAALAALERRGSLSAEPQSSSGATYAPKVEKSEAEIDWRTDAREIERKIRAFNPAPGAATRVDGAILKIWRARLLEPPGAGGHPGEAVIANGDVVVRCGHGSLLKLEEVQ